MKRYLNYLKYVLRHKYFVYKAGRQLGCGMWRLIMHDMSKFRPSEWYAYAKCFYKEDGSKQYDETDAFNLSWLRHQHRNPHHWQHWLLQMDRGDVVPLLMPKEYVHEMLADWAGAGKAITGKWEVAEWYAKNADRILLHPDTKAYVSALIEREGTWRWIALPGGPF